MTVQMTRTGIRFVGECRMCGRCCRPPFMANDVMLDEARGGCKHLWHNLCLIRLALETGTPLFFARDAEVRYWCENCEPYPGLMEHQDRAKVEDFIDKHWPGDCGYKVVVCNGDGD